MNNSLRQIRPPTPTAHFSPGIEVLKTGGTLTIMQRISNLMNWKVGLIILFVFAGLLFAHYAYKQYANSKTLFHANRENDSDSSKTNKTATLMLFYVDWCPHCKTAKPEWETLKEEYEGKMVNGYIIHFTEYNCTNETAEINQLMDKYSIEGYPTVKLLKDNQIIEYDAKPTKSTMEQFLQTVL
jgi:thiol-disulfide isomerase/thioredoxin